MKTDFARMSRKLVLGTTLAATLSLVAVPGMAQTGQGATQQPASQGMQQQPEKQDFNRHTLEKFASATMDLRQIQDDYAQKLRGIQDQEKAMELQGRINQKMVEALQDKGLEVQKYNAIASQMRFDEQLQQRVEGLITEQER